MSDLGAMSCSCSGMNLNNCDPPLLERINLHLHRQNEHYGPTSRLPPVRNSRDLLQAQHHAIGLQGLCLWRLVHSVSLWKASHRESETVK